MEDKDLKTPVDNINPQEEKPNPEIKEEVKEVPATDPNIINIEPLDVKEDIEPLVESKRASLLASYKKTRLIGRIFTGVVLALVVGAIIIITFDGMAFKIIGYVMAGLALAAMLVFYFKTRHSFPNISKEYIRQYSELINSFIFSDERFKDMQVLKNRKIEKNEVAIDRAYREGVEVGSRNCIVGKFNNQDIAVNELAIYYKGETKKNPRVVGFIGKYITLANKLKFEGRYIFNLKSLDPEKICDQPNDLDDLDKVFEEDNLEIYAPRRDYKEVFGTEFNKKLKELKTEDPLLNFVAVVWAGHTALYLSYEDSVTTIPFEHPFKKEPSEKYRSDLIKVLELFGKL